MKAKPKHAAPDAGRSDDAPSACPPETPRRAAPRAVPPADTVSMRPVDVSRKGNARRTAETGRKGSRRQAGSTVRSARSVRRRRNPFGVFVRFLMALVAVAALAAVAVGGTLAITEFRPRATQAVQPEGEAAASVQQGEQLTLLTWNIGYAGLPAAATSFTDGGSGVRAESREAVDASISAIDGVLQDQSADIVLLQEVDRASSRSFEVDQERALAASMEDRGFAHAFAQDHRVLYVPYPWPCLGKVDSGIMTASRFSARSFERIALEQDASRVRDLVGPESCLLVGRFPVEGQGKELVVANVRFTDRVPYEVQERQARELALLMKRESDKGNYVIAGGDFDQNFSGTDVRYWGKEISAGRSTGVLDQGIFAEGMQFAMDPSVATARSLDVPLNGDGIRFYVSDGFIASSNVKIGKVQTVDAGFQHSDHNPVRLEVTLG